MKCKIATMSNATGLLPRQLATGLLLPANDFWVFDAVWQRAIPHQDYQLA